MNKRKEKILGELGFTYAGLSGKTQKDFGKGKPFIPFMNIMTNAKIDPKFMGLVEVAPNERQNSVQKGDLFFTTSSETPEEVGMTSVLLEDIGECYLNSFCFGLRLFNFDDLLPEYAPYLFRGNAVRKQIINLGQGYTRFNLPKTELLRKLKLELPSESEQRNIAEILTKADSIIEKTQAAIAKYKAIKQGMLQDLFTRGIDLQTGKLRPRYQDAPELYKESKLGWIPREWEEITLGEIGEFKNGINKDKAAFGHGTLFVNIGDAYLERLDCSSLNKVKVSIQEIQDYQLVHGDLIFVRSSVKPSGVGYNTIFFEFSEPVIFCGFMIRYRLYDKSDFLPAFYNSYFRFEEFRNRLMGVATVSANTNVNQVSLSQLSAIRPTTDEQIAIADRIAAINNKLQIEQAYLQKMQYIKKGLMEDLLSGRKCLNGDFDDLHDSCDVASSNQSFKSQQSNQP
ncbi:MAG: restriction endonuclease subunit S [Chitinophagaceae bacterium]|nr:restriction endonuclease subunit S [Chitinophagaceae bacterium]